MHLTGATQSTSCHSFTYNLWFVFRLLLLSSGYNTGQQEIRLILWVRVFLCEQLHIDV